MSLTYMVNYYHPDGTSGDLGGLSSIDALYGVNNVGEMVIKVPLPVGKSIHYFKRWATAELYRVINGVP